MDDSAHRAGSNDRPFLAGDTDVEQLLAEASTLAQTLADEIGASRDPQRGSTDVLSSPADSGAVALQSAEMAGESAGEIDAILADVDRPGLERPPTDDTVGDELELDEAKLDSVETPDTLAEIGEDDPAQSGEENPSTKADEGEPKVEGLQEAVEDGRDEDASMEIETESMEEANPAIATDSGDSADSAIDAEAAELSEDEPAGEGAAPLAETPESGANEDDGTAESAGPSDVEDDEPPRPARSKAGLGALLGAIKRVIGAIPRVAAIVLIVLDLPFRRLSPRIKQTLGWVGIITLVMSAVALFAPRLLNSNPYEKLPPCPAPTAAEEEPAEKGEKPKRAEKAEKSEKKEKADKPKKEAASHEE